MSFRQRNKIMKKESCDSRVTLEAKHIDTLSDFKIQKINEKKNEKKLKFLNIQLEQINKKKMCIMSDDEIKERLKIIDEIREITDEIKNSKDNSDVNYLLDTGNLLFKYYENIDNVAEGKNIKVNNIKNLKSANNKSVMEYFKSPVKHQLHNEVKKNEYLSRSNIYDNYMSKIDDNYVINKDTKIDICETCNIEKTLFISDGKLICSNCGDETPILVDSDKPSYKDPPREVCYFAYKRINHFNEWLAQFQAKESTDIPKSVYNDILVELKKERITNIKELKPIKLREILKKLKKNKYYEHIPHIINKLNGIPPPIMSRKTEEELRRMFKEIQVPFHKYCPPNRKNFLSYSYVLHKFVQLLELDEFLPCFMLLKSREKLQQQDQIWKQICEHLKWQYIPSL
jgi:hypothetical protein